MVSTVTTTSYIPLPECPWFPSPQIRSPQPPHTQARGRRRPGECARREDHRHTLTRRPAFEHHGLVVRGLAAADWLGLRGRRSRFTVGSTAAWMLLGPAAARGA